MKKDAVFLQELAGWKMLAVACFGTAILAATTFAEPMTFKEISMLLRNGETADYVLDSVSKRKLAGPLTKQEEDALAALGGSPSFVAALRSPSLLATPEMLETARKQVARASATVIPVATAPAAPTTTPPRSATDVTVSVNRFTSGLEAAVKSPGISLDRASAYSLAELDKAKEQARRERKPLGFMMVWKQFFGPKSNSRGVGSNAAFIHFYQAFNDTLVLVYVMHETELDLVPPAVKKGFTGPDEGGFAPNMAVVDATASELILEIPMGGGNSDGARRDRIFSIAGTVIEQWLQAHPDAVTK